MISSVILFSALTVGTLAYRTSIRAIDKIHVMAKISDALPSIMETIKPEVMKNQNQGQGNYSQAIEYSWNSEKINSSRNVISSFGGFANGIRYGDFRISLVKIFLTIRFQEGNSRKKSQYQYRELLWSR